MEELSMPEDSGNPRDVVVEVRGGCVVEVYSAIERLRVVLIDWDDILDTEPATGFIFAHARPRGMPHDTATQFQLAIG